MRQDIRFFRCLYERLPSLLGIAFPFQANGIQCAAGEVVA